MNSCPKFKNESHKLCVDVCPTGYVNISNANTCVETCRIYEVVTKFLVIVNSCLNNCY